MKVEGQDGRHYIQLPAEAMWCPRDEGALHLDSIDRPSHVRSFGGTIGVGRSKAVCTEMQVRVLLLLRAIHRPPTTGRLELPQCVT